jgi:NYN domain-containing protein
MLRDSSSERAIRRSRLMRHKRTRYGAVLVDFENIYYNLAPDPAKAEEQGPDMEALDDAVEILSYLRDRVRDHYHCVMSIGRSYGDFDRIGGDAQSQLQLLAFEPRFTLGDKKDSAAKILLAVDAMEMLYSRAELEMFVIVGGDRDYLPVVRRLREHMKRVILVGFERATSGDLRQIVGEENFIPVESLLRELGEPVETNNGHRAVYSTPEGQEAEEGGAPPRVDVGDTPSDEQHLEFCMSELLTAYYQFGGRTVWLTPFLRLLNERFPYLDNRGRKRLVEDLQARNAIRIEKVEGDPYPYSVVEINWEDPWVQRMDEARGNS